MYSVKRLLLFTFLSIVFTQSIAFADDESDLVKKTKPSVRRCGRNVKRRLRDMCKVILVVHMAGGFSYPFVSVY